MPAISEINRKVNPLGVTEGRYAFYSKNTRHLSHIPANDMFKEAVLFSLVGDTLLTKFFPREKIDPHTGEKTFLGIDYKSAGKYLMSQCHAIGVFKPELMRGLGVWLDNQRIVINTGVNLIVDNIETEFDDFQKHSDYTYDQPGKQFIDIGEKSSKEDLQLIWDVINGFQWTQEQYPYLLLGALVQAIIGSTFDWRAHLWINGSQGSGKSYLQSKFIRPLLGKFCLGVEAGTTMAGITSKLGYNAYAVSYDEAEVRNSKDHAILSSILGLARSSSSQESTFIKGSASGRAVEYRCQSTFIMSSIAPFLKQESDIARFAILELTKPQGSQDHRHKFDQVVKSNCRKIDKDFSKRWVNYCISLIPDVIRLKESIGDQMAAHGVDERAIDQYGQLIACASAALAIDIDLEMFKNTLEETKENDAQAEPLRVFNKLMGSEIRIPTEYGGEHCTVLEAISTLSKLQRGVEYNSGGKYDVDKIFRFLCSYGLKVSDGQLYIANKSDKLEDLIGKPNWNSLFTIIPGFVKGEYSVSFGSRSYKSRYVAVELSDILSSNCEDESLLAPF